MALWVTSPLLYTLIHSTFPKCLIEEGHTLISWFFAEAQYFSVCRYFVSILVQHIAVRELQG